MTRAKGVDVASAKRRSASRSDDGRAGRLAAELREREIDVLLVTTRSTCAT